MSPDRLLNDCKKQLQAWHFTLPVLWPSAHQANTNTLCWGVAVLHCML